MCLRDINLKKRYTVIFKITALSLMALTMILVKNYRESSENITEKPKSPVEIPNEPPEKQPAENPPEQPDKIPVETPIEIPEPDKGPRTLINIKIEDLLSLEFHSENETLNIIKAGSQWAVNGDKFNRIDQKKVVSTINKVLILNSEETVSFSASDSEKWGISESSEKLVIKTIDGLFTILRGSQNRDKTGFYLQIQGTDKIFLIKNSVGESLQLRLDDLRDRNLVLFQSKQIETVVIKNEKIIKIVPYKRSDMFTADNFSYMMESPYNAYIPVSENGFNTFINSMDQTIQIVDFIDDGNSEEYGINDQSRSLTITEKSGKTSSLHIGSDAGNSRVYGKLNNEKQIFTVNKKDLPFLRLKPFDLVDKLPHLISMETIDTFMITNENLAVIGTIDSQGTRKNYSINGIDIEEKTFTELFEEIQNLSLSGEAEKTIDTEKPEIIISYKLFDGGSYWTHLNFYSYDSEQFALSRNEEAPLFIIEKTQLQDMIRDITATVDEIMGF